MINLKEEHFVKQYNCINNLKITNLKIDLTHITLINKILSYQDKGKKCYVPYSELAELLFISERKLYNILNELKSIGIIITDTKRLGPTKGSLTNLSIDLENLEKGINGELTYKNPKVKTEPTPEPIEEPEVIVNNTSEIIETFKNKYGIEFKIKPNHIKYFNDKIKHNKELMTELSELKWDSLFNTMIDGLINNLK